MKKNIFIWIFSLMGVAAFSQPYNNEWIDYSKTYYKFKVAANGLYRINQNALPAALQTFDVSQFQLWRNGQQIAIYTSVQSGTLPQGGYIEFWGQENDGKPDRALYKNPANQLDQTLSLETDTAVYFLTTTAAGGNLRIIDDVNDVAHNHLSAEISFLYGYHYAFETQINRGRAINLGEDVYSSTYDVGEWWSTNEYNAGQSFLFGFPPNLYPATSSNVAPALQMSIADNFEGSSGAIINASLNNILVITNQPISGFQAQVYTNNNSISLSTLNTQNSTLTTTLTSGNPNDRIVIGFIDLQYSRLFNFGDSSNFVFHLTANGNGNFLQITNFNYSIPPVLYDLTNNKRYTAVIANGFIEFALPPSALDRTLILVSEDQSNINSVQSLTQKNFLNLTQAANQGNYLIISNKILGLASGQSVDAYRAYRASLQGGGYNAKIYDIDELVDQFAFGIKKDPLSVKNFIQYARQKFAAPPQFVFLIGKAVTYDEYRMNQSSPYADRLNLVPTFGWPASDILLTSATLDPVETTPIGRLAAVYSSEVDLYLQKMMEYEKAQQDTVQMDQTVANKAWMKDMMHVVGVNDAGLYNVLTNYLNNYKAIVSDSLYGANVYTFSKATTGPPGIITNALVTQLVNNGLSIINYFGHASATILDYSLNEPSTYNNSGRYPVFIVNGCNAGNFYAYDTTRLTTISGLADKFVFAQERGAIGFIASTHFGVPNYLDAYNTGFYNSLDHQNYNKPVSFNMRDGASYLLGVYPGDFTANLHAEETVLHGDPELKINASSKPDFDIEPQNVIINPQFISITNGSFTIKCYFYNLGKAVGDSVPILIKRTYPDGSTAILFSQNIKSVRYEDSVILTVPINPLKDKGQNSLTVSIDLTPQKYVETTYINNSTSAQFYIYENELTPVYPYNFAIISKSNQHVFASTSNPILPSRQYVMQMDTTELFNSPSMITKTLTQVGGLLEFDPGISYADSTVYYWRTAAVPANGTYIWNTSSFIYLANSSDGWNQSHLYQHLKSTVNRIYIDSFSRQWNYDNILTQMRIINAVYGGNYTEDQDFQIEINGATVTASACVGSSIIFNVFDPVTLKPYYNQAVPSTNPGGGPYGGFMQSGPACSGHAGTQYNFEFSYTTPVTRQQMVNFMNWIPDGAVVTARLIYSQPVYAPVWKTDPLVNGTNLYYSLKNAGFSSLDSFYFPRTWIFAYRKNIPSFTPASSFTKGIADLIDTTLTIPSSDSLGFITSPVFGPAKDWKSVVWRGKSLDATPGDNAVVQVIGITPSNQQQVLYTLTTAQQNFDISSVNPVTYPYIQLMMRNADSIHLTPYQLQYWRILYDPVPEGALAPNIAVNLPDTLALGQPFPASIAFKNISDVPFADSIKVNITIYDKNNVATVVPVQSLRKLNPGDTALVLGNINTTNLGGMNNLFIDVNPNNAQPEQYHFNNFLYKNTYVRTDNYNPLLDVTFDGVHILNNDIVSAKPKIEIRLKDNSKYLLLNDTSLVTVSLKYPDGSVRRFGYGTDTLKFTPGTSSNNVATVNFTPTLLQDGQYALYVTGKDQTGNTAGATQYTVTFQVYNKPMITNMFNYPNPFTTSTAFVFTVTGSQVPQNIRIEILTITGKIVKEITKDQLGPLHIGRNITEYKWDGTDMYGQKLANGVYLYRVLTNLNAHSLDKFPTYGPDGSQVNTDQYFTKGYGKMYLMR